MKIPGWLTSAAFADVVRLALEEDAVRQDITSQAIVPKDASASGAIVAKAEGRLAGLPILMSPSPLLSAFPALDAQFILEDGIAVTKGAKVAVLRGAARDILAIERTLLNFLQRMSGIATETSRYVAACAGTKARIMETRKTCPGLRALDKYAVLMGGGFGHRQGLSDQILIKENHLYFCGAPRSPESVREAITRARAIHPPTTVLEVEVETIPQLQAAIELKADIVLLDNMTPEQHLEAVRLRRAVKSTVLLEVSGGVTLENVAAIAKSGVDRISVGALTHSPRALDLAIDVVPDRTK
jgi:nicotinate-nucleotide pyrophosphorylase (carboxylating)